MLKEIDLVLLGHRLRFFRNRAGITLGVIGKKVGRPAPYLSQLENGKVEPKLSLLGELAAAVGVSISDLLDPTPPDRRSELEMELAEAQRDPRYQALGLAHLKPTAKMTTEVLEHISALWNTLSNADEPEPDNEDDQRFADAARAANVALRHEMRERNNYFPEIEAVAAEGLEAAGYPGSGPISEKVLAGLAAWCGFTIERVSSLPRSARSVTDTRDRIIFIPDRGDLRIRQARSVVSQTIGHFALNHRETNDFGEYLRQRIESNYFSAAVLAPEKPAVDFLVEARDRNDISVEDLKELFYISYEMAAHRFTNLATVHLGIPCHFLRTDSEGVISKAYENDGTAFPESADGGLEGERVPRQWGARQAWNAEGSFLLHAQYTVTDEIENFCVTFIETQGERVAHAISLGTVADYAKFFRGSDTLRREFARAREIEPDPKLLEKWRERAWPSTAERSHVLSALPPSNRVFSPFPGIDLTDVYRFLDRQQRRRR